MSRTWEVEEFIGTLFLFGILLTAAFGRWLELVLCVLVIALIVKRRVRRGEANPLVDGYVREVANG